MNAGGFFVIKRVHSGTYFSIHGDKTPKVLVFHQKRNASTFMSHIKKTSASPPVPVHLAHVLLPRPQQQLVVEQVPMVYMYDRCSVSGLDICCVDNEDMSMRGGDRSLADFACSFENRYSTHGR